MDKTVYLEHPVSPEDKAHWRGKGYRILDAQFDPNRGGGKPVLENEQRSAEAIPPAENHGLDEQAAIADALARAGVKPETAPSEQTPPEPVIETPMETKEHNPSDVVIPDDWEKTHWTVLEKIAASIRGEEGALTPPDGHTRATFAKEIISNELQRRSAL